MSEPLTTAVEDKVLRGCQTMDAAESIARGVKITRCSKAAKHVLANRRHLARALAESEAALDTLRRELAEERERGARLVEIVATADALLYEYDGRRDPNFPDDYGSEYQEGIENEMWAHVTADDIGPGLSNRAQFYQAQYIELRAALDATGEATS